MINKPLPLKDLNIRIPTIIPIEARVFINQESTLPMWSWLAFGAV